MVIQVHSELDVVENIMIDESCDKMVTATCTHVLHTCTDTDTQTCTHAHAHAHAHTETHTHTISRITGLFNSSDPLDTENLF